jgi:hypothetical protein
LSPISDGPGGAASRNSQHGNKTIVSNEEIVLIFEINLLLQIKTQLIEYQKLKEHDAKYTHNPVLKSTTELLDNINDRLSHFCQHNIIQDIIEIGLDKTKTIYYFF